MAGRLLERGDAIATFTMAVDRAVDGQGATMLVTGEAGIGKTSVVRACLETLDEQVQVLAGGCDDLLAPRTLGPLRDAVRGTGGDLERALGDGTADVVFAAMADALSHRPPTVLVVEDVHWADDATLDLLSYLVRRVADWPALLLLSFRDDASTRANPVERLLAATATVPTHRVALQPLSPQAVSVLAAGTGRAPGALHTITGGNPFFVSEALAAGPDEVPSRVADLVLSRMHQFEPVGAGCVGAAVGHPDARIAGSCDCIAREAHRRAGRGRVRRPRRRARNVNRVPARAGPARDRATVCPSCVGAPPTPQW